MSRVELTIEKPFGTREKIACARTNCARALPYFSDFMLSTIVVLTEGLPDYALAGVDCWGRMYIRPQWAETADLDTIAGVVLHEVLHLVQQHYRRLRGYLGREPLAHEAYIWNLAADCTINPIVLACKFPLPDGCVFPEKFGLPDNLITEEYYELLRDKVQFTECDVPAGAFSAGSASDGISRPWESPLPKDLSDTSQPAIIDEMDQTLLARKAAERILHERGRGTVPGGLERWACEVLEPEIDARRQLLSLVSQGLDQIRGSQYHSYRRLRRRQGQVGILLPGSYSKTPRVTVIIDTSGSMPREDTHLACGLVGRVLNALPDRRGVRVLVGGVQTEIAQQVFRPEQIQLCDGGGTDMAHIIRQAAEERPTPQLIVVVTDGYTPWPDQELPMPVVACVVTDDGVMPPVWMHSIRLVAKRRHIKLSA